MNEFFEDLISIIIFSQKKGLLLLNELYTCCLTPHLENLKT